ncbi:hypothetical protein V5799_025437 [Amblyomma americanum]|uniref:F-box domain-containing protein n=1 Tax=Amblyomma americanum TaxID=6943 RepID=A0AAQ4E9A0_AMBAM
MDVSSVVSQNFVVESVLNHLDTEDLFTCAEVSRLWQSVALSLLRRKLISVSVCCARDPEELHVMPPEPSMHSCVDIFCTKFARFRNIGRMAGMHPSLVFVSCHADLNEDKRVVECLRELLPPDCVVVYFKLELVRGPDSDSEEVSHEGIFGEFLFRPEALPRVLSSLEDSDGSESQQQPPDAPTATRPSSPRLQGRPDDDETPATSAAAAPETAAGELVRAEAEPLVWPRLPSVGSNGGAVFHNVLPGVLMFQALHVTEASVEGNATTTRFMEEATRKIIQVTSAAMYSTMPSTSLQPFMRNLSDGFGPTTNTIAVAFPRNQDEARAELDAFERAFPNVPALANQATDCLTERVRAAVKASAARCTSRRWPRYFIFFL